jgi:hypothetical protein
LKPRRLPGLRRRAFVEGALASAALAAFAGASRQARAFGEEGAFNPRVLLTGTARWEGVRATATARWAQELMTRTSAPARVAPTVVRADEATLLAEPFIVWGSDTDVSPLTDKEVAGLKRFLALGGAIFVDEFAPERGTFTRATKRELARVIPEGAAVPIGTESVVFRSYYLLNRAVGRVEGPPKLEAIVRGGSTQVIFSAHDLGGAMAQAPSGIWSIPVTPNGEEQRERAIRLAVNIAMYVLCSNYKDDQVHAPFLMRRRAVELP